MGAALRLSAEAGQLLSIWRQSPLRVLARLHLVAAASNDDTVGRPRQQGRRFTNRSSNCRCRARPRCPGGWTDSRT